MNGKGGPRGVRSRSAAARRRWAMPPQRGRFQGIDLERLDPADPDERGMLIKAEHRALLGGRGRPAAGGMNPHLHLAIHEVVANQLWEGDPPEVWETAQRLTGLGYERHEVLHMLGSVVVTEMWEALQNGRAYDHEGFLRALDALPEAWERERLGE